MSFCRFSDDNWKSDVYAYESAGGFELHVASVRHTGDIPVVPSIMDTDPDEWLKLHNAQMEAVAFSERVPINGAFDGFSFTYGTLEALHRSLSNLREYGYHVPQFALDEIEEELKAQSDE